MCLRLCPDVRGLKGCYDGRRRIGMGHCMIRELFTDWNMGYAACRVGLHVIGIRTNKGVIALAESLGNRRMIVSGICFLAIIHRVPGDLRHAGR